jgi:uncharacterized protein YcbX
MPPAVAQLSYTPVKGTGLTHPDAVEVDAAGVRDDRLFHIVAAGTGLQVDAGRSALAPVGSDWDRAAGRLALRMPGGALVEDRVELGAPLTGHVGWDGRRPVAGREVVGPWAEALSGLLGEPVTLAMVGEARRAIDVGPVTLVSEASVARLEREVGGTPLGAARLRMNLVLAGLDEHEEDSWYDRRIAVGECVLRVTGPVPRCAVVTRDPRTGRRDADVLRAIVGYRPPIERPGSEPVRAPFGVYAEVERPGRIAVGDAIEAQPA